MSKKPKFRPVLTRIKLNPEQAVLACGCYSTGLIAQYTGAITEASWTPTSSTVCNGYWSKTTLSATGCGGTDGGWVSVYNILGAGAIS